MLLIDLEIQCRADAALFSRADAALFSCADAALFSRADAALFSRADAALSPAQVGSLEPGGLRLPAAVAPAARARPLRLLQHVGRRGREERLHQHPPGVCACVGVGVRKSRLKQFEGGGASALREIVSTRGLVRAPRTISKRGRAQDASRWRVCGSLLSLKQVHITSCGAIPVTTRDVSM